MSRYQSDRKKIARIFRKRTSKALKFIKKNFIIFLINLLFFGGIIVWWYFGYQYRTDPKHEIKDIVLKFDEVAQIYDQTDIEESIKNKFLWINKISYKWRSIIWKDITSQYERVWESVMTLSGDIVYVDIKGKVPNFVLIKDQVIANIATNKIYTSTKDPNYYQSQPDIYTPKIVYIKSAWYSITGYNGVFYNIGINTFVKQLEIITTALSWYNAIAYMPWGKKAEITMDNWQLLYFDLSKNTLEQIKKYNTLKDEYNNFYNYKIIDLGTIEDQVFLGN